MKVKSVALTEEFLSLDLLMRLSLVPERWNLSRRESSVYSAKVDSSLDLPCQIPSTDFQYQTRD